MWQCPYFFSLWLLKHLFYLLGMLLLLAMGCAVLSVSDVLWRWYLTYLWVYTAFSKFIFICAVLHMV